MGPAGRRKLARRSRSSRSGHGGGGGERKDVVEEGAMEMEMEKEVVGMMGGVEVGKWRKVREEKGIGGRGG